MHSLFLRLFLWFVAVSLVAQAPEVKERRLPNGFQVLLVERPGLGAVHAHLMVRAGRADTGALPAVAAELLARTLFRRILPGDVSAEAGLDALLRQEEGAFEALRLERTRRLRLRLSEPSAEEVGLVQLHSSRMAELRSRASASPLDLLDGLGATRREITAEADAISFRLDLPLASFEPWCRLEQHHLQRLTLARFALEREIWNEDLAKGAPAEEGALSILLGTAFSGHPYAQVLESRPGMLDGLTWSELRAFAHGTISPERTTLILVGDLTMERALPVLQETFGGLMPSPTTFGQRRDLPGDLSAGPGYRRLQASTAGDPRLFMAWRVPPASHPDSVALKVLVQILGGSKNARLLRRVQEARGLTKRLSIKIGVPGGRDPSLLLIEAVPAEGHGLAEVEEAIHSEILRTQNERFEEEELRRAQRQVASEQLRLQEDASTLAEALGRGVAQSGDWQQDFRARNPGHDLTPDDIQAVAKRYLVSSQGITALLEADPLLAPRDPLEGRLGKVLGTLVQRKVEDPAQAEGIVRETLRQLRMLSVAEREQTLKLLEAQAAP